MWIKYVLYCVNKYLRKLYEYSYNDFAYTCLERDNGLATEMTHGQFGF